MYQLRAQKRLTMTEKSGDTSANNSTRALDRARVGDGQSADLAQSLYSKPEDFRRSMVLAQGNQTDSHSSSMKAFDGKAGAPQLVTNLPADFSSIPEGRRREILGMAAELLKPYTNKADANNRDPDGKVSFGEIGSIMDRIAKRPDLSELEKCRLWSDVRIGMGKMGLPIQDCDQVPKTIDSWHRTDRGHALVTLDDGYHGNRLINMTPEQASKAIIDHENGADNGHYPLWKQIGWQGARLLRGINQGDVEASEGQLKALRALRETGMFADYAKEWKKQFVRSDVDSICKPR